MVASMLPSCPPLQLMFWPKISSDGERLTLKGAGWPTLKLCVFVQAASVTVTV